MTDSVQARREAQLLFDIEPVIRLMDEACSSDAILNDAGIFVLDAYHRRWRKSAPALPEVQRERILAAAASLLGAEITHDQPSLAGVLGSIRARIQGSVAPLSPSAEIVLRRPPMRIFTMDGFDCAWIAAAIRDALVHRKNIVISGSTGSGKTRLLEAILRLAWELLQTQHIALLEDASEIRSPFELTSARRVVPSAPLRALVYQVLRLNPDRIVIGEVRGAEAHDLLKAWGTGHPGGITTIHASSAMGALMRLEQLTMEANVPPQQALIGEVVDLVLHIEHGGQVPAVVEGLYVNQFDASCGEYLVQSLAPNARIGPNGPQE